MAFAGPASDETAVYTAAMAAATPTQSSRLQGKGPYLLAAGLTALLLLLAFLQHHWLVQVSEAERDRARAHVRSAAAAFTRDFNEPLNRLAFDFLPLFQIPRDERSLAELLAGRLERWRSTASEPALVKTLWILHRGEGAPVGLRRLDEKAAAFEPIPVLPEHLIQLVGRINELMGSGERGLAPGRGLRRWIESGELEILDDDIPALVLPLPGRGLETFVFAPEGALPRGPARPAEGGGGLAWLILELDRQVLLEGSLPRLAAEYFPERAFGLRIVKKADPTWLIFEAGHAMPKAATIEVEAELFGPLVFVRPPRAVERPFEIPAPRSRPEPPEPPLPVDPPEKTEPLQRAAAPPPFARNGSADPIAVELPRAPAPRAPAPPEPPPVAEWTHRADPVATTTPAPASPPAAPLPPGADRLLWFSRVEPGSPMNEGRWQLQVFHQAGSLDAAVDAAQRRNLGLAFGILLVLGTSMLFLAKAASKAQELARRQMELVAGVTHELLTPLAAMKSAGQNLRDGVVQEPPKVARYGELIVKESDRLSSLVGQVLLWAGLSSEGTGGRRREKIEPRALAAAVLEEQKPGLETANFEVELVAEDDLPPLDGDPLALRQALGNLVANAIKYGRPATGRPWLQIAVRREKGGRQVVFTVADHGEGIAAADLPHLFEPFYRGQKVVASTLAGAGLGLALVRRIAEAHGGEIRVDTGVGRGATFFLSLPVATQESP